MSLDSVLKNEEKTVFSLRALYQRYGYLPYRMSKFEAYDLYAKNKDFLVSENIITFTDTDGKLLALKPDVTLSIIKNGEDGALQKVYYNENVYRVSPSTGSYKEIMQVGLECIGKVDDFCTMEVLYLAYESLKTVSDDFVLDLSHMGIISELIDAAGVSTDAAKMIVSYIGEKNVHDMTALLEKEGASEEAVQNLSRLVTTFGPVETVLPFLKSLSTPSAAHLAKIAQSLGAHDPRVRIDFSVTSDMNYYNGIVFQGFVSGIPGSVLSGGQYDNLMQKMHRNDSAIGFAVYLDALSYLDAATSGFDVEAVLLYPDHMDEAAVMSAVEDLQKSHKSVMAVRELPNSVTYQSVYTLTREGVTKNE